MPKEITREKKQKENKKRRIRTLDLALISLFAAIIAILSLISIPFAIPFSMQSLGILFALAFLGGKRGTLSILIYLTLGAVGLPIFAGANGGVAAFVGPTGGFLVGWLIAGLCAILVEATVKNSRAAKILSLSLALAISYAMGTAWYVIYLGGLGSISVWSALLTCVLPFVPFDALKLVLAYKISNKIKK